MVSKASPLASSHRLCFLAASVSSLPSEMHGALVSSDFTSPATCSWGFVQLWSSSVLGVPARRVRLVSSGSRFLGIEDCKISFSVWRSLAFLFVRRRVNLLKTFLSPASVCHDFIRHLKERCRRLVAREKFCFLVSCDGSLPAGIVPACSFCWCLSIPSVVVLGLVVFVVGIRVVVIFFCVSGLSWWCLCWFVVVV